MENSVNPVTCTEISRSTLPLPPNLPENSPVEVTFKLNEQGRLDVNARELSRNLAIDVIVQTERVISKEEVEEAKQRMTKITSFS